MKTWATIGLAILLAQSAASAKIVEDHQYNFRADFPGKDPSDPTRDYKLENFDAKGGALKWRSYTSSGPETKTGASYTAVVKVYDTDSSNARELFNAGEADATQSLAATLIKRADGTFGPAKLPSVTLTYQGATASGGPLKGTVLLVAKGTRLYSVMFYFSGPDQTALGEKFIRSFEILN